MRPPREPATSTERGGAEPVANAPLLGLSRVARAAQSSSVPPFTAAMRTDAADATHGPETSAGASSGPTRTPSEAPTDAQKLVCAGRIVVIARRVPDAASTSAAASGGWAALNGLSAGSLGVAREAMRLGAGMLVLLVLAWLWTLATLGGCPEGDSYVLVAGDTRTLDPGFSTRWRASFGSNVSRECVPRLTCNAVDVLFHRHRGASTTSVSLDGVPRARPPSGGVCTSVSQHGMGENLRGRTPGGRPTRTRAVARAGEADARAQECATPWPTCATGSPHHAVLRASRPAATSHAAWPTRALHARTTTTTRSCSASSGRWRSRASTCRASARQSSAREHGAPTRRTV